MTTHRPDGTGKTGWWPFDSPDGVPTSDHGRWLLVLLDPTSHRVVAVAIDDPEPAVTIEEQKRVWVATKNGVYLLDPAGTLVELDVAARLRTEYICPTRRVWGRDPGSRRTRTDARRRATAVE